MATSELQQLRTFAPDDNPLFHITSEPSDASFTTSGSKMEGLSTGDGKTPENYIHNGEAFGWPMKLQISKEGFNPEEFEFSQDLVMGKEWNLHIVLDTLPSEPLLLDVETIEFWVGRGFTTNEADAIAKWVIENKSEPTDETINQILIDAGLREPPEEISLIDRIKSFIISLSFAAALEALRDHYAERPELTDEQKDVFYDAMISVLPIGAAGRLATAVKNALGIKPFIRVAERMGTKNVSPLEIERYLAEGKYLNLLEYARTEPKLFAEYLAQSSVEVKSLILKGLKQQADPTAYTLAREALRDTALKEGGTGGIIPKIITGRNVLWGLTGMVGALSMAYGIAFGTEWFVKEGLIEQFTIPLSDRMREYRRNPTPELLKIIESQISNIERVIPLGLELIQAVSWLWPLTKDEWDEYIDGVKFELQNTKDELAGLEPPKPTGRLIINPTPSDAKVSVEGQIPSTGVFNQELDVGIYNWIISKFGFISQTGVVQITENEVDEFDVEIFEEVKPPEVPGIPPEEVTGKLIISAIPEDAIITVAGHEDIQTPGTYEIKTGSKGVKAEKEGFVSQTKNVFVRSDIDVAVSFILKEIEPPEEPPVPKPKEATITFTSNPSNADIYINGKYTFTKTPYTTLLEAGNYILRVQKAGFFPNEIQAEVLEGETDTVNFILQEIPTEQIPIEPFIPFQPALPRGFEPLFPVVQAPRFLEAPLPAAEKELLVNIETTDAKPWKGRIYSIALLDLSSGAIGPTVLTSNNEEKLLRDFINAFNSGNFKRLIGFKLTFDHRYIFNKLMLYRMQSKKWAEIDLRDVKQLLDQVKEEFVYFPDKTGTLDDYGKSLLGKGKYGSQSTMLKMFLAKNFDYVNAFQNRQIEITRDLYDLFRFSASEGSPAAFLGASDTGTHHETTINPPVFESKTEKPCKNCLQVNPLDKTECFVCGNKL